jgi:hypothetical protein
VQAGDYRDDSSLEEFCAWVDRYRNMGFIDDNVRFIVTRRGERLVGVLRTPLGEDELGLGDFLVFNGRAFFVNHPHDFWREYRDIDGVVTLPRTDHRVNHTSGGGASLAAG